MILAHGFKLHEEYKPLWRHVPVPETFLLDICPMAEANAALTEGLFLTSCIQYLSSIANQGSETLSVPQTTGKW